MKLHSRPDGRTLRHHFSYNWWQYALIIVLSFVLWNLIYTQTAYRPPGERRIDLYVQSLVSGEEEGIKSLRELGAQVVPEVEEVNVISLLPPSANDAYAGIQLMTFLSAREGDIYVLGTEDFKRLAIQGALMPLDEQIKEGTLSLSPGIKLESGYLTMTETLEDGSVRAASESRLYGIPLQGFPHLARQLGLYRQDMFLSVPYYCDNLDSTLRFIKALLTEGVNGAP